MLDVARSSNVGSGVGCTSGSGVCVGTDEWLSETPDRTNLLILITITIRSLKPMVYDLRISILKTVIILSKWIRRCSVKLFAVLLLVFVTFGCKSTDSESNSILKASRDETYIAPIPRKIEQRFCNLFDRNKRVPVAFFDADSTLRISKSGNVSANDGTDVNLLPFVAGKIRELNDQGYLVAVISNQGGVTNPRVNLPEEEARNGLRRIAEKIHSHPVRGIVHYIDYATGESGSGDMFRKGIGTGMATTAGLTIPGGRMGLQQHLLQDCQRRSGIDWNRSFMVGDSTFKKPKWKQN